MFHGAEEKALMGIITEDIKKAPHDQETSIAP
jgi:hypothetical protein